jgi:predicted Zn-dependent peptidase
LYKPIPCAASVSIGLWVKIGSRHESVEERGYTHFLEHMLFKGTAKRTAKQIAEEIERVGGYLNAATTREYTYFYTTSSKMDLELCLDILSDMVFCSKISKKETELESSVILEEMKGYEDSPEDYVFDYYYRNLFQNNPLGLDIIGNRDSIQSANSEKIKKYYSKYYTPDRMILCIAGDCKESQITTLTQKYFSQFRNKSKLSPKQPKIQYSLEKYLETKKIEQVNLLLGLPGIQKDLEKAIQMSLFNQLFGGGMASRLFQNIREEKGLCYSIYSYSSSYEDSGVFSIYSGCAKEKFLFCVDSIIKEIRKLKKEGISKKELEDAKSNQKGMLAISYEVPESQMLDISLQEIYFQKFYSVKDRMKEIDKVSLDKLNEFVFELLTPEKIHLSVLGNIKQSELKKIDNHI